MGMFDDGNTISSGGSSGTLTTNPPIGFLGVFGTGKWAIYSSNAVFTVPSGITKIRARTIGGGGCGSNASVIGANGTASTVAGLLTATGGSGGVYGIPGGSAGNGGAGGTGSILGSATNSVVSTGGVGGLGVSGGSGSYACGGGGGGSGSQLGDGGKGGVGRANSAVGNQLAVMSGGGGGVNLGDGKAGAGGSAFGPASGYSSGPDINGNSRTGFSTQEQVFPTNSFIRFAFDGFTGAGGSLSACPFTFTTGSGQYFMASRSEAGSGGGGGGAWSVASGAIAGASSSGGVGGGGGGGINASNTAANFASNGGIGGGGGGEPGGNINTIPCGGGGGGYAHGTFTVVSGTQYAVTVAQSVASVSGGYNDSVGGCGFVVIEW